MVIIYMEIPFAPEGDVHAPVAGDLGDHVIEEAEAGGDLGLALAVEGDADGDLGLAGGAR
jgi:hypothetical protein